MYLLIKSILQDLPENKRTILQVFLNFLFNHPFKIIINIRLGQHFFRSRNPFLRFYSRILKNKQMYRWSCDISYDTSIGRRVVFGHPIGIVIGNGSIIEDDVKIWQNVTLGSHGKGDRSKQYPTVKSGARIYAGAKIIGGVTIGRNSIVAANAVVNIDVPDNCIAVGVPCKIIERE
jgi:serine O-acetyltransferase